MNRKQLTATALAITLLVAAGAGLYWLGVQRGSQGGNATSTSAGAQPQPTAAAATQQASRGSR